MNQKATQRGGYLMGIKPQRIDNLIEYLDKLVSEVNLSEHPDAKHNELLNVLRIEVIEVLKIAFSEGDPIVRRSAMYGLSKVGLEYSFDLFVTALNDPDEHVRGWAAEALGRLKDLRAITPLIKALADENHYVCFNISTALKQFPPEALLPHLTRSLQDSDPQIRRRICKLLGEIGDSRVTEALITALKDEEAGVRYESAEALRKLKNPSSILPLIAALNDPNHDVQAVAIMALGSFGDTRAVEPLVAMLIEEKGHRHACLEALRNICGEENLGPLFELIHTTKKLISNTSNQILENIYLHHKKSLEASNA